MISKLQMLQLLDALIARTDARELDWKQSPKQKNTYFLSLGEGVVSLMANKQFFWLGLFNHSGSGVANFKFRGEHLDEGSDRVKELYMAARDAALGADQIFESMLNALTEPAEADAMVVGRIGAQAWPDHAANEGDFDEETDHFALDDVPDPRQSEE